MLGKYRIVEAVTGIQRVSVPAGRFSTVRIRTSISMTGRDRESNSNLAVRVNGTGCNVAGKRSREREAYDAGTF